MGQHDAAVDAQPAGAQVPRRLDLVAVQRFDGVVEREDHEQDVDIHHADDHPAVAAEEAPRLVDDAKIQQDRVQRPVEGQDDVPGEGAQQFVDPEGHDQHQDQQRQPPLRRHLRQIEGDRIADGQRGRRDQGAGPDRLQEDRQMDLVGPQGQVIPDREHVLRPAELGRRQRRPEGEADHHQLRQHHQQRQPQRHRQQDRPGQNRAVPAKNLRHSGAAPACWTGPTPNMGIPAGASAAI